MSENGFTPDTERVRKMYATYHDNNSSNFVERWAEFNRWLAKHDEKVARDAVKAERLRVLGLLQNAERMHNLYRTVWWNQSPHPSGLGAAKLMTYLLRAELMGADDE
jgi:hypothetical protein